MTKHPKAERDIDHSGYEFRFRGQPAWVLNSSSFASKLGDLGPVSPLTPLGGLPPPPPPGLTSALAWPLGCPKAPHVSPGASRPRSGNSPLGLTQPLCPE